MRLVLLTATLVFSLSLSVLGESVININDKGKPAVDKAKLAEEIAGRMGGKQTPDAGTLKTLASQLAELQASDALSAKQVTAVEKSVRGMLNSKSLTDRGLAVATAAVNKVSKGAKLDADAAKTLASNVQAVYKSALENAVAAKKKAVGERAAKMQTN